MTHINTYRIVHRMDLLSDIIALELPLKYDFTDGRHIDFDDLTIDFVGIVRDKNGDVKPVFIDGDGYEIVNPTKDGKQRTLRVGRAVASTFFGRPPTLAHTADHGNRIRRDNHIDNISWKDPSGQTKNQVRPETYKSALIVIRDGLEMTIKEWVEYLKDEKTSRGNLFTIGVIKKYAQRKSNGFSYKVYTNLPGEIWKEVPDSKNSQGRWEVSNKKRVKYKTKHADRVLDVSELCKSGGYPTVNINGKNRKLHQLVFQLFHPEKYAAMTSRDVVRHKKDDKLDCRPEELLTGTRSQNVIDAHDNDKYDNKKTERKKCVSYIDGKKEKEHISLPVKV